MPFLCAILLGFILLWNQSIYSWDAPSYKIVIDPGHGGNNQNPYEEFGDKYDTITGKFLEKYKPGTSYKGRTEREIVLELSKEVTEILELTKTKEGFAKFKKIASNYTKSEITPIQFNVLMTRTDDYTSLKQESGLDENYKYRLYDFPDKKSGKKVLGRMSVINKFQPYLVVSIHLNPSYPGHPGGMAAVIAPPYRVFQQLRLISNGKGKSSSFTNSAYGNWLQFVSSWNHLENAMTDTWIYFNGYWSDRSGKKTDLNKFAGYRQNMVTWRYADPIGWEEQAKLGGRGAYAKNHNDFIARGKFWNRERGQAEAWRRDYGREGLGGDNLYASNELLRFVQYGLRRHVKDEKGNPPSLGPIQPPYISTYSLPTYINAICAFLEIGYIDNDRDMKYIQGHKKQVAESLAVGIYSLFRGVKPIHKKGMPYIPKGKQVNFKRYENYEGKNYFKIVSE
ncbi:N-acetylmuramoyl-L-alanine amidase [Leptospira sp. GIMC2001]|uniref:N-acetylmuramoyl-L-alanine amidase n=1 Tax=Leptospira sp. GIMC2001 TaxID=1513297 RepID=UPI003FA5FDA3